MAKYIAKKIRVLEGHGTKILWELCPPLEGFGLVITSAVDVPYSGPETYVFPANEEGEIISWAELVGSYKGKLDHKLALYYAGYSVSE